MKKYVLLFFVIIAFQVSFSEGLLGLRTLESKETQASTETTATFEESSPSLKLNLRTIDPLLVAFKEGFKTPSLPGWSSQKIGELSFKIPNGFSFDVAKNGLNYDAKIMDTNSEQFAQLFLYQLESYQLDELFDSLVKSLYSNKATGEKAFEEFKDYPRGMLAYFTRIYMSDQKITYPILFAYQKGETNKDVLSGQVLFLFVEPSQYQAESDLELLNSWIEGIAGSLLNDMSVEKTEEVNQVKKKVEEPVKPSEEEIILKGNNFGSKMAYAMENVIFISQPPKGWSVAQGDTFEFFYPHEFDVEFHETEDMEVADLGSQGTTMAKLFIGETEEYLLEEDILDELYFNYLSGLGSYTLVSTTPYFDPDGISLVTYEVDFRGYKCWITIFSESDSEGYLNGEFLIFLGIAPLEDVQAWQEDYLSILLSLTF